MDRPRHLVLPTALAALLAAGCAGPQVRSVGHGAAAPAYALQADSAAALRAEAKRLCPDGYLVLRESVSTTAPESADEAWGRALVVAGQWLSGEAFDQAQATIVCRG